MNSSLTPAQADEYARWFHCLADGTRLRILQAVAIADGPLTVGEVVDRVGKGQSTVSHHLGILAAEEFVLLEPRGTRTLVRVNAACLTELPEAADRIMGRARP